MPQIHYQQGLFHVTTNTQDRRRVCLKKGIPELLIHTLDATRSIHGAKLHAFCILPNHIHLLAPGEKGLSKFMQTFKSNSTKEIRKQYKHLSKTFRWQAGFYDERIRDERQRSAALHYILGNAVKHKLVKEIMDYPWTSLHFPSLIDPLDLW